LTNGGGLYHLIWKLSERYSDVYLLVNSLIDATAVAIGLAKGFIGIIIKGQSDVEPDFKILIR
jgi:hypothetical protein